MRRLLRLVIAGLAMFVGLALVPPGVWAEDCAGAGAGAGAGDGERSAIGIGMTCTVPPDSTPGDASSVTASNDESEFVEYRWVSVCTSPDVAADPSTVLDCAAARACPDAAERMWRLWARRPDPGGGWASLGSQCFGQPPTIVDAPTPEVTPGMVLEAIRRIGLPRLVARTQPAEKTLVNFATIFYAEPEPFTRSIRLLGRRVEVEATPTLFTWRHGDGTSASTGGPGGPYPSKEITYLYRDAHTTVRTSVDVTYTARFRVGGGAWRDIAETVTVVGPSSGLRISEATAVLSGQHE